MYYRKVVRAEQKNKGPPGSGGTSEGCFFSWERRKRLLT